MASIALDPRLLAPPEANATADTFRAYVDRLLKWSSFAKEKGCTVTISRDAQQQLMEDGTYPFATSLRDDLKAKGINEYDFPTLKMFCEGFFRYKPCFQEHVGVSDILHEGAAFSPAFANSQNLPNTTGEAEKNLVTLALLDHYQCRVPKVGFAMQTSNQTFQVAVSALLQDIEHNRTDLGQITELPQTINGNVTVCSNLEDFAINFDKGALFMNASNDDQLRLCIKLALYKSKIQRHHDLDWEELPPFRIGRGFRARAQTVVATDVGLATNIVGSIVDAIENLNLSHTHSLRESEGSNAKQREWGDMKAWRRDITRETHLHYWKGAKNLIELGWVSNPHNDMHLPDPNGN